MSTYTLYDIHFYNLSNQDLCKIIHDKFCINDTMKPILINYIYKHPCHKCTNKPPSTHKVTQNHTANYSGILLFG